MQSVFTLNANDLDGNVILALKQLFGSREIEITVRDTQSNSSVDETEYLLGNAANKRHLLSSLEELRTGHKQSIDSKIL